MDEIQRLVQRYVWFVRCSCRCCVLSCPALRVLCTCALLFAATYMCLPTHCSARREQRAQQLMRRRDELRARLQQQTPAVANTQPSLSGSRVRLTTEPSEEDAVCGLHTSMQSQMPLEGDEQQHRVTSDQNLEHLGQKKRNSQIDMDFEEFEPPTPIKGVSQSCLPPLISALSHHACDVIL